MKRGRRFAPGALLMLATAAGVAQMERDTYRDAYRAWRAAEPALEHDAAAAGATMGARADKAAAEAAKYYAARITYLEAQRVNVEQKASAIEALPVVAELDPAPANYVSSQSAVVGASVVTIAKDPDPVIQRLRQSLEQERNALVALSAALSDTRKGVEAIQRSSAAAEQARVKLVERYRSLAGGFQESALETTAAVTLWAGYYRTLSEASRGPLPRGPALATLTDPRRAPGGRTPASQVPGGQIPDSKLPGSPAPVMRTPAITPLPLFRYVGAWNYPTVGAQYRGAQPQAVELLVREENGQAKGTLMVKFLPPLAAGLETELRLDFEGPLQRTRNQSFPLVTSSGAKGTIELIPGPAINLLEVSYKIDATPARQGGFLLVKK